jgi:hypothetical protein
MAFEILDGFGDSALGEWTEDRPKAFHLRRRLKREEERRVGPACDLRGKDEGLSRLDAMKKVLQPVFWKMATEELIQS